MMPSISIYLAIYLFKMKTYIQHYYTIYINLGMYV